MPTADARPWPERAGRDLNALGVPELRVPGSLGSPGAQRLDVGQLQAEPAEVELQVEGQAAVAAGQHEPVAAQPVRVAGIVTSSRAERACTPAAPGSSPSRDGRCRPFGPRRRQAPDGVDRRRVDVGPVVGVVRSGERRDLFECGHRRSPCLVKLINPHPSAGVPAFAVQEFRVPTADWSENYALAAQLWNGSRQSRENLGEQTLRGWRAVGNRSTIGRSRCCALLRPRGVIA